jgi:UDP-glucuronate decarboxylase
MGGPPVTDAAVSEGSPASSTRVTSVVRRDAEAIATSLGPHAQQLAGSTVLITGASGFLCSYLVDSLVALNDRGLQPPCRIVAVDSFATGIATRLEHLEGREDLSLIRHDVTQPLPDIEADWIIHGASIASPSVYRRYPLETIDVNVQGTRNALELARRVGVHGVLYISSSEVYGDPEPAFIPTSEEYRGTVSFTGPRACYDESKRLAETLCMTYYRLFDLPVKIVRPFNVYGPSQRLDDGRIIPDLMHAAVKGESLVLRSDGGPTRAFCYITDAVRAMWRLLLSEERGEAFNVGNDEEEITIRDLAVRLREVALHPVLEITLTPSEDLDYLTDNPQRRCPDLTKLKTRLSWKPEVSLTTGLRRTLTSYREAVQQPPSSRGSSRTTSPSADRS